MMRPPLLHVRKRLSEPHAKRLLNQAIFAIVAPRYDTITRMLSLGCDSAWKDRLVRNLPSASVRVCVDLACGTGDLTLRLAVKYPDARVIGLDLSADMLDKARTRTAGFANIHLQAGDLGNTGLAPSSVDIITGGYALRNAGDLTEAIREIHRILRPGGTAAFLDFSKPQGSRRQAFELFLLRCWGGFWGVLYHRDPAVYTYIADSLAQFPDRRQLAEMFQAQRFEITSTRLYFGGIIQQLLLVKRMA
ncbi:MAG: class I SAM-dependent methyltransferase [bacterium]